MKEKIDVLQQHVLVPLLLALASIAMVMALYFCSEWLISAEVPEETAFFTYEEAVSSRAYQSEMGGFAVLFLLVTVSCIGAVFVKQRLVSFMAVGLAIAGIFYLGFG
ncbi:hypothetical protein [Echinicola rosea]|uniref:Uncharacterized protein n=1 Tax=Echinicola rosea TaxID=1807691 RepID=A0ABQ1V3E5_9BACT|nr:hypothetical protein [Echinicola rosea]GGF34663.1 hypothetical protein GCM10011339_23670 [Echinicola rosea]